jgi:ribose transport system substrate-binding protein
MDGGNPQTHLMSEGVKAAATALGWNFKDIIVDQSNPSQVAASFLQALQFHPALVTTQGTPPQEWQSVLPDYEKAGVLLVPAFDSGDLTSSAIPTMQVGGEPFFDQSAQMLADWFIQKSDGKGHALLVNLAGFPQSDLFQQSFLAQVSKNCSGCSVSQTSITIPQAVGNQGAPVVVSAIRRDPSIKYVLTLNSPFLDGLSSALSAAGLSDVQWGGASAGAADETAILAGGSETVGVGAPELIAGWLAVDAGLRHMAGMSYPDGYGALPIQLLTSDNKSDWTVAPSLEEPANYAALFKATWKLN